MYSPDGFASLACAMTNQCFFLGWQEPFIELMKLIHGNYVLFFVLQAIVWFASIGSVYFLAKELKVKHLFLVPFILIFGSSLFIDNYVGNFENDYIAIVLFIVAFIFYVRNKKLDKYISLALFGLGTSIWMWIGYFRVPLFWSDIAEMNWWVQIMSWGFLLPLYLLTLYYAFKLIYNKNNSNNLAKMFLLSFFFPKLWFFAIPFFVQSIDLTLSSIDFKNNYKFYMSCIMLGLLIGQTVRVGVNTWFAWTYETDSKCYLVNHEYLARVKGISLNYNQASIYEYNECLKNERIT